MLPRVARIFAFCIATTAVAETQSEPAPVDDEVANESLSPEDKAEILEYTQKEEQDAFDSGVAVSIGPAMPWSKFGLAFLTKAPHGMETYSLGTGAFEFNDNESNRNYVVTLRSQSAFYTRRIFPLGFGPLYVEPIVGLVRWDGDIQPRGTDPLTDEVAASLSSRFNATGLALGGNIGIMWMFQNQMFIEYNLFSLNGSYLLSETYSTNTNNSRNSVRKQLRGPMSMNSVHLRLGWSWSI
ncbi:MAG: hypothetical protein ACOVS5_14980 [Oligoflexus sp.]